ncbi:alpha/beta hydrolase family protein [Marinigracilibium pacificum]|uniref:Platelet-activating factor acetylhydrolase n=1 Tax=Marinigracilibium pacificum TaxID=2729599 RepID=A0A848IX24_9BACT|nr:hypothetical protein [Marinigracilibium pacificum]NMM47718.1 hypothetical protein [Marinigracilibium pacificum]
MSEKLMRTFEVILLVTITIFPFIKRPLLRYFRADYILIFLGIILLLHLTIEGWRWQMIPVYIITPFLGWRIKTINQDNTVRLSFLRFIGFTGLSVLILIGWLLPTVLPVFSLPEPQGKYNVGTELVYLKTDKNEYITKDPNDKRELLVKIWYPSDADVSSLEGESYIDQGSRAGFAMKYGLPPTALNYLDYVKTYVYQDIPVANQKFPVLIFSHGYGSKATGYYALLTELASHGYIIINMNHTYESLGVTLPNGNIKYFDYDYQGEISSGSMEVIEPIITAFKSDLTFEHRHPIVRKAVKEYFEGDIQDRWVEDMTYTLDLLDSWNNEGLLKGKLDLNKIGVIGHSVGGGSAGKLAFKDNRIKAAVNLDGNQWGQLIDSKFNIPFLYVSADWPAEHEDINSHIYINKSSDIFYETKLLNSGHPNFMDIPLMVPVPALAGTGEIDPYQGIEIVNNLVIAFFDKHLKNLNEAKPELIGSKYDLLEMKVYKGDSANYVATH